MMSERKLNLPRNYLGASINFHFFFPYLLPIWVKLCKEVRNNAV